MKDSGFRIRVQRELREQFLAACKAQDKPAEAASALKFFAWAYKNGDKMAEELEYVPMPAVVKAQVEKAWAEVKDTAGKPVAFK